MKKKNILWIMADQLRYDYLGCYGHKTIKTPVMDSLAAAGVKFTNAYVNAGVCGPSRMCYYTGRSMTSHGSTWNGVPLRVGEPTLGDHLRPEGYRVGLVGKTHMIMDVEGFKRLGLNKESIEGVYASQAGFEPYARDDGLHPDAFLKMKPEVEYNQYLKAQGYDNENPWHFTANSAEGENGETLSGWLLRHSNKPAIVPDEHSETAFTTNRAMDFIRESKDQPWLLHVSYIKPHWPYIVSPPYHDMYSVDDIQPVNASENELKNPHPVYKAFMEFDESKAFSKQEVREAVIPAYMGLISQLDAHLGRLIDFLDTEGLKDDTVIVISSDHGDYLGDHWLGEKELFHDASIKVPLIIVDPSREADAARGTDCSELVQAIDLAATFSDIAGCGNLNHILEGKSLSPLLQGKEGGHQYVVSEIDFAHRKVADDLGLKFNHSRGYMVATEKWKYVFWEGARPQLFDLENDPKELIDLGESKDHEAIREAHRAHLYEWFRHRKPTITIDEDTVLKRRLGGPEKVGVIIGQW